MPNRAMVFVSEAVPSLGSQRLELLMADAERFNRDVGITGVTLFDGSRFLAYMEGPADALSVVYARVSGSTSHAHLIELAQGRVGQRRLPYWPMRLLQVTPNDLRSISVADWSSFVQRGDADALNATAMDLLVRLASGHTTPVYSLPSAEDAGLGASI